MPEHYLIPLHQRGLAKPGIELLKEWAAIGMWGVKPTSPHVKGFEVCDRLCFYLPMVGVVAEAVVSSKLFPIRSSASLPEGGFDLAVGIKDFRLIGPSPIALSPEIRGKLLAFRNKAKDARWSWFVQQNQRLTGKDFNTLTGRTP